MEEETNLPDSPRVLHNAFVNRGFTNRPSTRAAVVTVLWWRRSRLFRDGGRRRVYVVMNLELVSEVLLMIEEESNRSTVILQLAVGTGECSPIQCLCYLLLFLSLNSLWYRGMWKIVTRGWMRALRSKDQEWWKRGWKAIFGYIFLLSFFCYGDPLLKLQCEFYNGDWVNRKLTLLACFDWKLLAFRSQCQNVSYVNRWIFYAEFYYAGSSDLCSWPRRFAGFRVWSIAGFGSLRFALRCRLHVAALAYGGSNNLCFVSLWMNHSSFCGSLDLHWFCTHCGGVVVFFFAWL